MNIYKNILTQNTEKLLNLYDLDPASPSLGYGDRLHWGWKVSDFPNATLQGGVHALAIGVVLGIHENEHFVLQVIDKAIRAIPHIASSKGSLQEAYPNEHSFCVTALVAFDGLSAIERLGDRLNDSTRKQYLQIIAPLIDFITRHGEEHAIISNHLATGVAAIVLWNKLSGNQSTRHEELLQIILAHQSSEGWYMEYEGPDLGYQTLCIYYLAAALEHWPSEALKSSLSKAIAFQRHFLHPDHSIGGLYGSRNTEVYYPGGLVYLQDGSADHLAQGIAQGVHLLPQHIDIGNYCPLLNAYAFAAYHQEQDPSASQGDCFFDQAGEKNFPEAGLYLKSTARYFAIMNYKKGGVLKVFDQAKKVLDLEDGGLYGTLDNGTAFSTQGHDDSATWDGGALSCRFTALNQSTPSAFTTVILRLLGLTLFRSVAFGNFFKKKVVKLLMTGKKEVKGTCSREFIFHEDRIEVLETLSPGSPKVKHLGRYKSIHMASSGYHLKQHQSLNGESKFVTFR